jgi:RimJ/RimL family protein N-acetyltransferase
MDDSDAAIPHETLETIARSFFKAAVGYGFHQMDYIRFVNLVLDMSMKNTAVAPQRQAAPPLAQAEAQDSLPLEGGNLAIRRYNRAHDCALLDRWMTDKTGRYFLLSRTTAQPLELHELLDSDRSILGVITGVDGLPIGLMAFLDHDRMQRKAELRKLIGDVQYRGKGYGKEATALWVRYGISSLGLKKIYLNTLETDLRNIRLNEELGFKVEGILRNECWFDGEYHDILRMALLVE